MPGSDYKSALAAAGVGYCPLYANRHAELRETVVYHGEDLTGATIEAEVRLTPDTPGDPLTSMQILSTSYSAPDTTFILYVNQGQLAVMPAAGETGDNVTLYWDLRITRGSVPTVEIGGEFVIVAGVTQ